MNNDFLVISLPNSNLYDVFAGKGWMNWSRVLVKADFVHVVKGDKIAPRILYQLFEDEQKKKSEVLRKEVV